MNLFLFSFYLLRHIDYKNLPTFPLDPIEIRQKLLKVHLLKAEVDALTEKKGQELLQQIHTQVYKNITASAADSKCLLAFYIYV